MSNLIPTNSGVDNSKDSKLNTFTSLSSWMDDLFSRNLGNEFMSNFNTGMTLPAVNIKNSDDEFIVEMAVPGLKKSDFDINLDDKILTISAETQTENEEEAQHFTRREFGYSSFKRTFTLPETVETEKINAKYHDGILEVHLPKREEAKKKPAKTIKIS
ncbi:Hsp20/alpha crystallin family protein [Olleya sp. YS]|uniref:Hsp20/alpha crystallin family protein n=1 Tax=Olleya sp. YS TaxID=3028318 RepID=UPI0024345A45|nr:Hsp20/alpha crystallin family protein [Olleya sp. YS]WGD34498.1 Hsp20/alpha crystallin family protein [Olleya sp. YS]